MWLCSTNHLMRTKTAITAGPRPQAQKEYWKSVNPVLVLISCFFERILEDMVPPLDQTVPLGVVGGRGAVVDVVELALLSSVAAGELGASAWSVFC